MEKYLLTNEKLAAINKYREVYRKYVKQNEYE